MGASNELFVVHRQDWIVRIEEFRMEYNLDAIRRVIEQLAAAQLVQDRVLGIVDHIVRDDWW